MAHAAMDYHSDFFSLLALSRDSAETKSEIYAHNLTSTSSTQNHHQVSPAGDLSSPSTHVHLPSALGRTNGYLLPGTGSVLTDQLSGINGTHDYLGTDNSFAISHKFPLGTKRSREGPDQFEAASPSPLTAHSNNGAMVTAYLTEECGGHSKVFS